MAAKFREDVLNNKIVINIILEKGANSGK